MADKTFRLKPNSVTVKDKKGVEVQSFTVSLIPPPAPVGCKVEKVSVNGVMVENEGQTIGNVSVFNFSKNQDFFAFRLPKDAPPPKVEVTVVCDRDKRTVLSSDGTSTSNPIEDTADFLDDIVDVFKKVADFLTGGFKELIPEELADGLKKIKELVGKGVDVVTNLLPGVPIPTPPFIIPLPGNLEHLKKKIGEHLKDLDPLDNSPEAVIADAKALRALILEDVIPYMQQVGDIALKDLELYSQRLSVMQKMVGRLDEQLDLLQTTKPRKRTKK